MYIYIDGETLPSQRADIIAEIPGRVKVPKSYKDEKKIAEYRENHAEETYHATGLSGDYGELCCVCWAIDDGEIHQAFRAEATQPEAAILAFLWSSIQEATAARPNSAPVFVGHNVEFDLRFLHHRSIVLGARPPIYLPYNAAPWQGRYRCTQYEWSGAKGFIKLTELCRVLGIEVDDEIDGSQVWQAFQSGEISKIVEHCRADVDRVRQIAKRLIWDTRP